MVKEKTPTKRPKYVILRTKTEIHNDISIRRFLSLVSNKIGREKSTAHSLISKSQTFPSSLVRTSTCIFHTEDCGEVSNGSLYEFQHTLL